MAATADTPYSAAALVVFSLVGILVFYAIYLTLLHPLHNYPGPLLAKLTNWYAGSHVLGKDIHLTIYENHIKYGPVVRLAPNRLVFNTTTALHDIYQSDRVSKPEIYHAIDRNNNDSLFTVRDKTIHKAKRRMVSAALSERNTRSFEPIMSKYIDVYLRRLLEASQASEPVNFTECARYLALDITAKISFGYDLNAQTKAENRFVIDAIAFGLYRGNIFYHLFFLSRFYFDRTADWLFSRTWERYVSLLERMIGARVARGKGGDRDFYSFISELGAEEGSMRQSELFSESQVLVVAGSDTTATALSATFFYLSRNPDSYAKLCSEIRAAFPSGAAIKPGAALSGCRYLRACLDEGMRMSPPVPGTLWRTQDANDSDARPLVVDGHVVPKGTLFGVSAYALHHNEAYFPDSFAFKPERWLSPLTSPSKSGEEKEKEQEKENNMAAKQAHDAFAAFSTGARSCAGKALAYLESSLVLAKTLWYFDFEAAPGKLGEVGGGKADGAPGRRRRGEFQLQDIFTSRHDGPYLVFRPRGELWREFEGAAC
ncbi:cytochrome P450 [Nemania sp. FL0031]|nr:cytochrome P450 [Nemania sp. FL0031]